MDTLDKTEATCQWFDERNAVEAQRDAELQDEQRQRELQEDADDRYDGESSNYDRGDLIDDGRSDGYGESYSERNR